MEADHGTQFSKIPALTSGNRFHSTKDAVPSREMTLHREDHFFIKTVWKKVPCLGEHTQILVMQTKGAHLSWPTLKRWAPRVLGIGVKPSAPCAGEVPSHNALVSSMQIKLYFPWILEKL